MEYEKLEDKDEIFLKLVAVVINQASSRREVGRYVIIFPGYNTYMPDVMRKQDKNEQETFRGIKVGSLVPIFQSTEAGCL